MHKYMKKLITTAFLSLVAFVFAFAKPAFADGCGSQSGTYGGNNCPPDDLIINKQVFNPVTKLFVENIMASDNANYSRGSEVQFRVTVMNASGETFNPVTVTDTLPPYLAFVAGPGIYDKPGQPGGKLTVKLENVIAGETRSFEILTKVAGDKMLFPANQPLVCQVKNVARASVSVRPEKEDIAEFCIQNQVLGASALPVAGFDDLLLLVPFAGLGLSGIALLRRARPERSEG